MAENYRDIYDTERSLQASDALITELGERSSTLERQRRLQETRLRQELISAYQSGPNEPLKMLLNQESNASAGRMFYYYRTVLAARARTIEAYQTTLDEIEQNRLSLDAERDRQKRLLANLTNSREQLTRSQQERESLLSRLEQSISETEQQLASRLEDRERLETLLRNISERMQELDLESNRTSFSDIRGNCSLPTSGTIAARFGSQRTGSLSWDGLMIETSMGKPVSAVHHGRVVFADYLRGYGLLVIIDHGDDYLTLYGHNQSLFVESGDWVNPGQQIAQVGISGGLRDPALYFEIRRSGEAINPQLWCD